MIKPQNSHYISISFPLQPNPSTPISHTHNNFLHNMITTLLQDNSTTKQASSSSSSRQKPSSPFKLPSYHHSLTHLPQEELPQLLGKQTIFSADRLSFSQLQSPSFP
jgi:hypothetical protein